MSALQLEDIQGLTVRAHAGLSRAVFVLLHVRDKKAAGKWLTGLADSVSCGYDRPQERAVQIAFTYAGLKKLGLDPVLLAGFSREFQEGMVTPHRSRSLGDHGDSAPTKWKWGRTKPYDEWESDEQGSDERESDENESDEKESDAQGSEASSVHILLMVYANKKKTLSSWLEELLPDPKVNDSGVERIDTLKSRMLPGNKEHFGFHDGISQPRIAGLKRCAAPQNTIAPGEFVLGYLNEYGYYPDSPTIEEKVKEDEKETDDPASELPRCRWNTAVRDFGANGTYLVFRQLKQRVRDFWAFLDKRAESDVPPHETDAERQAYRGKLAAKMVGRWPSGAPLVLAPDRDVYPQLAEIEEEMAAAEESGDDQRVAVLKDARKVLLDTTGAHMFGYYEGDPDGVACPFGSHLRRANPRDTLIDDDEHTPTDKNIKHRLSAVRITRHHRIIRRGRPYGKPVQDWMHEDGSIEPDRVIAKKRDPRELGLHFIGINADIARQFEFIQHAWLNQSRFPAVANEVDPILGDADPDDKRQDGTFTAPSNLVRTRVEDLQRWVQVKGGAYFFMPGIRAIRYLGAVAGAK